MNIQQGGRRDKNLKEERNDTYRNRGKYAEPTACRICGATFMDGRWTWAAAAKGAEMAICPACQRIADRLPAGRVEIRGNFFLDHRTEILNLIRNEDAAEKKERPLERIMAIADEGQQTLVTTTGIHLARRIGEALAHSYQGTLGFRYGENEGTIRVHWSR